MFGSDIKKTKHFTVVLLILVLTACSQKKRLKNSFKIESCYIYPGSLDLPIDILNLELKGM